MKETPASPAECSLIQQLRIAPGILISKLYTCLATIFGMYCISRMNPLGFTRKQPRQVIDEDRRSIRRQ